MLGKWFIVVVMSTSTPQLGIDLFVVEEMFKTKEECMTSNMVDELLNVDLRTKTQI